jgi:hypothetical protein
MKGRTRALEGDAYDANGLGIELLRLQVNSDWHRTCVFSKPYPPELKLSDAWRIWVEITKIACRSFPPRAGRELRRPGVWAVTDREDDDVLADSATSSPSMALTYPASLLSYWTSS